MKAKEKISENLHAQYTVAYELSLKLKAWAAFIEKQPECEGYPELEGLGLSLREYGEALDLTARELDEIGVDLAALVRGRNLEKKPIRSRN